jgi:two-component system, OmpR family, response regulator CpxR
MRAGNILLIDDDRALCELMRDFLGENGFRLDAYFDGLSGLSVAVDGNYDLVLLDVMLPRLNGFDVLRQLRRRAVVPVIMLTARIHEEDRILGLDAGADDYLAKPFGPGELLARVRAVLRRCGNRPLQPDDYTEMGLVKLHPQSGRAWLNGIELELTGVEFDILEFLVRSQGRVVKRDELSCVLNQRAATPFERSLDVHISHLRKKLEWETKVSIRTVRGIGYAFTSVLADA